MLAICPPFFLQKQRFLPRAAAEGKSQTIFIPVGGKNMQKLRKFLYQFRGGRITFTFPDFVYSGTVKITVLG